MINIGFASQRLAILKVMSWRLKPRPSFTPKSFLAKVGECRSIGKYRKDQIARKAR